MSSLYDLGLSVPWHMTSEALAAMLSIAARDPLPEEEIKRRMHGPKALALRGGQRRDDSRRMTMRDGVAIIPIDGPIYRYADFFTAVSGGVTTESLARDFQAALDDTAARAILFVIDSPGGEVTGINEVADAIYAARGRKPIGAYIEGHGASAAYWIASAADVVWADDTARIGSIGTVMGVPDPARSYSRTIDFVSSQSPRKRADPTTDTGRAYFQNMVDQLTDVFLAKVARNRGRSTKALADLQGGLLIGQAAVAAGLADALGSEEGAIRALLGGQWRSAVRAALPTTSRRSSAAQAPVPVLSEQELLHAEVVKLQERAALETENARLRADLAQPQAPSAPTRQAMAQVGDLEAVAASARAYAERANGQRPGSAQRASVAPAAQIGGVGSGDPELDRVAAAARAWASGAPGSGAPHVYEDAVLAEADRSARAYAERMNRNTRRS